MKNIRDYVLYLILSILIIFFILYIFSNCFRYYLSSLNIDPNFLVAFVTVLTLIVSIIGNRQERKYHFNLNLKNSVEDKTALVIGKLFVIMNNAQICFDTIKTLKQAISENKKFIDVNNTISFAESFNKDRELLGAYIEMYFKPHISENWNLMRSKMSTLLNNCSMLLVNYNENHASINNQNFNQNDILNNINQTLEESKILNDEIYKLTEKMKNTLLEIVVENNQKIKNEYLN